MEGVNQLKYFGAIICKYGNMEGKTRSLGHKMKGLIENGLNFECSNVCVVRA